MVLPTKCIVSIALQVTSSTGGRRSCQRTAMQSRVQHLGPGSCWSQSSPICATYSGRCQRHTVRTTSSATIDDSPSVNSPASPFYVEQTTTWDRVVKWSASLTQLFPLWVLFGCVAAFLRPPLFLWFKKEYLTFGIALTMMGMGFTLSVDDFADVLRHPARIVTGVFLQYTIMPMLGFLASRVCGLSSALAVGVVLVACCPGGTASNIVSYIAGADVALSVGMTSCSTALSVVMTPLLTQLLAGTLVPVDGLGLFRSTLQVVLIPVLLGIALKELCPRAIERSSKVSPLVAVLLVALICASVVAQNAASIAIVGPHILSALSCLHLGGFALGYLAPKWFGFPDRVCRTTSIEVGMQNSTLGALMAIRHFGDPMTSVPAALSACYHSVVGSILAGYWRGRKTKQTDS